jgi:hypothetical protein
MAHFLLHKEANAINRSKKMRAPRGSKSKKKMREFIADHKKEGKAKEVPSETQNRIFFVGGLPPSVRRV